MAALFSPEWEIVGKVRDIHHQHKNSNEVDAGPSRQGVPGLGTENS